MSRAFNRRAQLCLVGRGWKNGTVAAKQMKKLREVGVVHRDCGCGLSGQAAAVARSRLSGYAPQGRFEVGEESVTARPPLPAKTQG